MRVNSIGRSVALIVVLGAFSCRSSSKKTNELDAGYLAQSAEPGISIELTPDIASRALNVRVRVSGPAASSIQTLRIARSWAETHGAQVLNNLEARDTLGDLPVMPPHDEGPDKVYTLSQKPRGELVLSYQARALYSGASNYALAVHNDRVSGVGHGFLLLPPMIESINTSIEWHLEALPKGTKGASSFGAGERQSFRATSSELANAVYAAGPLQIANGPAGERMIMLGQAELDIGAVFEWTLRVRDRAKQWFVPGKGQDSASKNPIESKEPPFVFMLVAEPNMGKSHDGAHLTHSIALWFDAGRALDPQLRIALSHELIHRYIGSAVRLSEAGGLKDAVWFSEGFTVHYARQLLFHENMISAADFAADLDRTFGADPENGTAAVRGQERDESYRIGALYAAHLDAALRKRSGGARSLNDLMRELLARAESKPGEPILIEVFQEMIVRELGPDAGRDFEAMVLSREKEILLPEDIFGPCFGQKKAKQKVFDIGFDLKSLDTQPIVLRGVVKGSAAARAGVRDGALVLSHKLPKQGDKDARVELWIAGGRGGKKIRYKPVATRETILWKAKKCKRQG